jgi:hypothetical protein
MGQGLPKRRPKSTPKPTAKASGTRKPAAKTGRRGRGGPKSAAQKPTEPPKTIAAPPVASQPPPRNEAADALEQSNRAKYEARKEKERRRQSNMAAAGRDIGKIPEPKNPERREACRLDLEKFLLAYFPHKFFHGFSDDLREAVRLLQRSIITGGQFALAMPRAGGKSTIAEGGALWATLYGHRRFVLLIGASKPLAVQSLENIQAELLTNEDLADDFPATIVPIRALENIANRSAGQLHDGKPTYIKWKRDRVVFATIEGSTTSGSILRAAGLTGSLRGLNEKGRRPDFAIPDDWQTDKSARSHSQTRSRLNLINGAVLGLAGPGKTIAVYSPVTVIAPGDGADQLLDKQLNPEWESRRYALLKSFPDNMELWSQYNEIRRGSLRNGGDGSEARAFYKKHRREMDKGGAVAWEARKFPDDLSALEHAMKLFFKNPNAFFAEYQNQPKVDDDSIANELKSPEICKRLNGLDRYFAPLGASRVTAYIDVQHSLLYYVVVAWGDDFGGDVVDYGTFPRQGRPYFSLREARATLQSEYPKATTAAAVEEGLRKLTAELIGRQFPRERGIGGEDTGHLRIELCSIDWSDGNLQDTVARVCRTSPVAALLLPAEGKGIGPAEKPMHAYAQRPGERLGTHWLLRRSPKQGVRAVTIDSNFWKSHVADALTAPQANPGAIRLFGRPGTDHELFADHCIAETRAKLTNEKTQRSVDVWRLKTNKPDNHFFDCLVGATVTASIRGCTLANPTRPAATRPTATARPPAPRERVRPLSC